MSASQAIPSSTFHNVERFVSADAAAMFLGITRRTLLQKVREGKIPAHRADSFPITHSRYPLAY